MRKALTKVALAGAMLVGMHLSALASSDLGIITGTKTIEATTAAGSFADLYNFSLSVDSNAGLAATSVSFVPYGATVSDLKLYAGSYSSIADLTGKSAMALTRETITSTLDGATITTLASAASGLSLGTPYTLLISGTSIGTAGYTGIIALTSSVTAPVPEPETYAMLVAGLGMMGFIARRRQKRS